MIILSDPESLPKNSETIAQTLPLEEIHGGADQNGREDNESKLISGDKTSEPCIDGEPISGVNIFIDE